MFDSKKKFDVFIKNGKKNDIVPIDNDRWLHLPIASFVFKYKLQTFADVSYEKRCHLCKSKYIKDQWAAEYYLYIVTHAGKDVTNEFEKGGNYSESVIGLQERLKKVNDKYKKKEGSNNKDMMIV